MTEELRSLALRKTPGHEIRQRAVAAGMTTLRQDGWNKCCLGVTTVDEVLRVTHEDLELVVPVFAYRAADRAGRTVDGVMEAYDANAVVERLHREDYYPAAGRGRPTSAAGRAGGCSARRACPRATSSTSRSSSPPWWRRACRSSGPWSSWATCPPAGGSGRSCRT